MPRPKTYHRRTTYFYRYLLSIGNRVIGGANTFVEAKAKARRISMEKNEPVDISELKGFVE